jgi:hypothetical protein
LQRHDAFDVGIRLARSSVERGRRDGGSRRFVSEVRCDARLDIKRRPVRRVVDRFSVGRGMRRQ